MKIISRRKYDVRKSLANFGISEFLTVEAFEYEVICNKETYFICYEYEDIIWFDSEKNEVISVPNVLEEYFEDVRDEYDKQLLRVNKLERIIEN